MFGVRNALTHKCGGEGAEDKGEEIDAAKDG